MKKLFSFFAATLMAVAMSAETVTFTFKTDADITYTATGNQGGGAKCEVSKGGVTLVGSDAYTDATKTLNVYAKSTLTVSVIGTVNKIDVEYNGKVYAFDEALGETTKGNKFAASGAHPASYTPETPAASIVLNNSNGGKTELLSLTVDYTPGEAVKVTGITLDKSELALWAGETATLVQTITPADASNKSVIWSTSDEKVATVANGTVTAVGKGSAVITAETKDGGFKANCNVVVSVKEAPEGAIFYETFDKLNNTGGNDGKWSGTIATVTTTVSDFDNEGWTAEGELYKANQCLSIRKNSDTTLPSGVTTPALGKAGNGKVQFMAESWGTDGTAFYVDIVGEGSFVADEKLVEGNISNEGKTAKVIMARASKWTTFTLQFEGVTADSKIRFYAPANKRAFLDEVAIWVEDAPATGWDGTVSLNKTSFSTIADLEGLQLTFTDAVTIACLDEDADYIALENGNGSELYAIWSPAYGGTYTISENVATLNGWYTDNTVTTALPAESATLYLEDMGTFKVDGNADYFETAEIAYEASKEGPQTTPLTVTISKNEENLTFTPDNNELQYAIALLPWDNYVEAATSATPEAAIFNLVKTFTTSTMGMFVKTGEQSVALADLQELIGDGTFAVVAVGVTNEFEQNGEIAWKKIEFAAELPEFDVTLEAKKTVFCVTPADNTISYGIVAITADEIEYSASWGISKEQVLNTAQQRIGETYTGYHYFGYESDLYAYAAGELTIVVWAGTYDEEEEEFVPSHKMQVYTVELKEEEDGTLVADLSKTAINNAEVENLGKMIVNGELVIVKDGVRYNVLGARK